jgi:hypothetical protein
MALAYSCALSYSNPMAKSAAPWLFFALFIMSLSMLMSSSIQKAM